MQNPITFCTLITCYNKREFIADAIKSARAEYTNIIVVDDCSFDNSREIINSFNNIDKLFLEKNSGVTKATIAGLERAVTLGFDYVILLDGDDVLAPGTYDFFHNLVVEQSYTAIYSMPNRSKHQDMRSNTSPCKFYDVEEVVQPLKRWLKYGKATTALCAKPKDMLASINSEIEIQDHQIGYSIHKNAKKIGYTPSFTHFCSRATGENLSKNKYVVSISDIKLFNSIYDDIKNHAEIKYYAKRIHKRCCKLQRFPKKIGLKMAFELYFRRFIYPYHTTQSVYNLSEKIIRRIAISN